VKKICVVHGVGFSGASVEDFAERLRKEVDAEVEVFGWNHPGCPPKTMRNGSFMFGRLRSWVWEIVMDYTYAVKHLDYIASEIPKADMYVGYSGGGIIISDLPGIKVYVAAPVTLVKRINPLYTGRVLNIMHYRDPVAAPMPWARNVIVKDSSVWRFVNPLAAHMTCMEVPAVLEHTVKWFNEKVGN
jgi:hypothetical protein